MAGAKGLLKQRKSTDFLKKFDDFLKNSFDFVKKSFDVRNFYSEDYCYC